MGDIFKKRICFLFLIIILITFFSLNVFADVENLMGSGNTCGTQTCSSFQTHCCGPSPFRYCATSPCYEYHNPCGSTFCSDVQSCCNGGTSSPSCVSSGTPCPIVPVVSTPCFSDNDCGNNCGVATNMYCTFSGICSTRLANQNSCISHNQCSSGNCLNGVCNSQSATNLLWREPCSGNSQCASGSCVGCVCACNSPSQCPQSNTCESGTCVYHDSHDSISSFASDTLFVAIGNRVINGVSGNQSLLFYNVTDLNNLQFITSFGEGMNFSDLAFNPNKKDILAAIIYTPNYDLDIGYYNITFFNVSDLNNLRLITSLSARPWKFRNLIFGPDDILAANYARSYGLGSLRFYNTTDLNNILFLNLTFNSAYPSYTYLSFSGDGKTFAAIGNRVINGVSENQSILFFNTTDYKNLQLLATFGTGMNFSDISFNPNKKDILAAIVYLPSTKNYNLTFYNVSDLRNIRIITTTLFPRPWNFTNLIFGPDDVLAATAAQNDGTYIIAFYNISNITNARFIKAMSDVSYPSYTSLSFNRRSFTPSSSSGTPPCTPLSCSFGQICNSLTGTCITTPCSGVTCPFGQMCNPSSGTCILPCLSDSDCGANCGGTTYCSPQGQCFSRVATGNFCSSHNQCLSGNCVTNICSGPSSTTLLSNEPCSGNSQCASGSCNDCVCQGCRSLSYNLTRLPGLSSAPWNAEAQIDFSPLNNFLAVGSAIDSNAYLFLYSVSSLGVLNELQRINLGFGIVKDVKFISPSTGGTYLLATFRSLNPLVNDNITIYNVGPNLLTYFSKILLSESGNSRGLTVHPRNDLLFIETGQRNGSIYNITDLRNPFLLTTVSGLPQNLPSGFLWGNRDLAVEGVDLQSQLNNVFIAVYNISNLNNFRSHGFSVSGLPFDLNPASGVLIDSFNSSRLSFADKGFKLYNIYNLQPVFSPSSFFINSVVNFTFQNSILLNLKLDTLSPFLITEGITSTGLYFNLFDTSNNRILELANLSFSPSSAFENFGNLDFNFDHTMIVTSLSNTLILLNISSTPQSCSGTTSCISDSSCSQGNVCECNVCISGCRKTPDCSYTSRCVRTSSSSSLVGTCTPYTAGTSRSSCTGNLDCSPDEDCVQPNCMLKPCTFSSDCPSGFNCVDPSNKGGDCMRSSSCGGTARSQNGGSCSTIANCQTGLNCCGSPGTCQTAVCTPCGSTTCASGQTCNFPTSTCVIPCGSTTCQIGENCCGSGSTATCQSTSCAPSTGGGGGGSGSSWYSCDSVRGYVCTPPQVGVGEIFSVAENYCYPACESILVVPTTGQSLITVKTCKDTDNDGKNEEVEVTCDQTQYNSAGGSGASGTNSGNPDTAYTHCLATKVTDADAQIAGFEKAVRTKGACGLESSLSVPLIGLGAMIIAFIILIIYYIIKVKRPRLKHKKIRKVLKKKKNH